MNNGIALSGTARWMFDRGLIGLSDDLQILISRQANDPDAVRALINQSGRGDKDIFTIADALDDPQWRAFIQRKAESYRA